MVYKKSVYTIDSVTDTPTEVVRKGSTIRLANGLNEWILLEDWENGIFSAVNKYSSLDIIGVFQTRIDLGANEAFDISIDSFGSISMVVEVTSTVNNKMYIASFSSDGKTVILSNGVTYASFDYDGGILKIANAGGTAGITAVKISVLSSDEEFNYDSITVGDEYVSSNTADIGYNDKLTTNASAISQNTSVISQNTSVISQNTSAISQNASAISQNTSAITAKVNISDLADYGVPLLVCNISCDGENTPTLEDKKGIEGGLWSVTSGTSAGLNLFRDGSLVLHSSYIVTFGTISDSDTTAISLALGELTSFLRLVFKDASGNNIDYTSFSGDIPMVIYKK